MAGVGRLTPNPPLPQTAASSCFLAASSAIRTAQNEKLRGLPTLVEKVNSMEQAVQCLSQKFDEFQEKISKQDNEIKDLRKKVTELEEREEVHACVKSSLQQQVNDLEFRSRRLDVHGLPVKENENLMSSLNEVADKLEIPQLVQADVASVHRLAARKDYVPGIIVRFTKQEPRDAWLKKKNDLQDEKPRIFFQENLTRQSRELLRSAKEVAKEKGYKFAWYVNGKVLVRKTEGAHAFHIKDRDELEEL
ncbi:uncharacterized protein [Dermacentor albipictus]|uniref:uncharacterized protein n=1 Tax=Dermacentor albipictus TaxID=60249 RepID=UPI0038FC9E4D